MKIISGLSHWRNSILRGNNMEIYPKNRRNRTKQKIKGLLTNRTSILHKLFLTFISFKINDLLYSMPCFNIFAISSYNDISFSHYFSIVLILFSNELQHHLWKNKSHIQWCCLWIQGCCFSNSDNSSSTNFFELIVQMCFVSLVVTHE